jgi:alkylation response protein AidB-like acyl-CoA dehydrogenase
MHFDLTPEDQAFRQAARAWLRAHVPAEPAPHGGPAARDYALGWLRQLHAGGWSGIAWPLEYGGLGLAPERQMIWCEEYVQAGAPSVLNPTFVSLNHAGPTLMARGTEAQKAFHLPKILAGEVLWCQGFSEPDSGSDLASLRATGSVSGNELIINGTKIWSSYADIADYQELLVRTDPGSRRHAGLSWVICDMKAPGITVRPIENLAAAVHFAEVFYDDVRIPLANVVGPLHGGWDVAMTTLGFERSTAAAALQLELTRKVDRLAERALAMDEAQLGTGLLHELALVRAQAAAMRALTYRTVFKDPSTPFDGSIVRLYFAELSQRIHALGMKILGPLGNEFDTPDEWTYHYLESFSETIAGGTSEIQRNIIGERILGLPRPAAR